MKVLCTRAGKCDSGATAMEYALTAAILSVALLTGADTLGSAVTNSFNSMSQKLAVASPDRLQTAGGTSRIALDTGSPTQAFGSVQKISYSQQP